VDAALRRSALKGSRSGGLVVTDAIHSRRQKGLALQHPTFEEWLDGPLDDAFLTEPAEGLPELHKVELPLNPLVRFRLPVPPIQYPDIAPVIDPEDAMLVKSPSSAVTA